MQSYAHRYLPILQDYQQELLSHLQVLVDIDSGTGQVEGVNQIISYLQEWLQEAGFSVTLKETEQFGRNLVARGRGRGRLRLLLVGHVDTVYPQGAAATRPFSIQNGIASGAGVIDMKSGLLMGMYAIRALRETGFEDYGEIILVWNNDEEVGSPASAPLLREIARNIDVALVLEPTRSAHIITQARKGADRYVRSVVAWSPYSL